MMTLQIWSCTLILSVLAFHFPTSFASDKPKVPSFAFGWLNDNNTFEAGEVAAIKIIVLGEFDSKGNASLAFNPILTVNGKKGNSSFVSGVSVDTSGDTSTWKILFTPIRVGVFNVFVTDDPFKVFDSSLHFNAVSAKIYPSVCIASWMGGLNEFEAGSKVVVFVVPRDAFGNNISSTAEDLKPHNFSVSALYANGSIACLPNISHIGWNEFGLITIEFVAEKAGNLLLDVKGGNQSLNGSPLPLKVNPGPLDVSNCLAKWKFETNIWQIFSKMEIFVNQQDQYGNLVSGLYDFDADIIEKETNLSIPVADLQFEEVSPGIQLLSFSLLEPGNFLLTISDAKHNTSISNMPFAYNVFIGYCDGSASIVNGSGLNDSIAGEIAEFSFYLVDTFQYPSFVESEIIEVQIVMENESLYVQPTIHPIINGSGLARELSFGAIRQTEIAAAPSVVSLNNSKGLTSAVTVTYKPEKSGIYEIYIFVGNILLGGGHSFRKEVKAGEVDVSLSKVVKYDLKVPKMIENEIEVQLMDAFSNPVLSQQSLLNLEVASVNRSGFSVGKFVDNKNGSYTCQYLAKDAGTYEMCVSYDGKRFTPCPFGVNVYSDEYFPKANDDNIDVWEDESIALDVLANDYYAENNASIVEFSKPVRGSLLQYGHLFRYTPYQDYFGNDSFMYTMADVNSNLASAIVNISILNIPPQFILFPSLLQATEDMISPSGLSGFEVKYSEPMEKIAVTFRADSGTLFLSPMLVQFWHPIWEDFSVKKEDGDAKSLILQGSVEVINLAIQSIQYLGIDNFSGGDTIRVSASNINGKNDVEIPTFVEPINDPPFINVPKFIILNGDGDKALIFDKSKDKFEFCVGDPDILNFPGEESHFIVTFSVEVDDGFLVTSLSAELINTTELKLMNSYQWQSLQAYVSISKHFTVKANGIRFRGTINDCNLVMQQLSYHGGENGGVLTVKVNDLGHYGCYLDCSEKVSIPLQSEATINLIWRTPMSSFTAQTLGSAVILEFLVVLCLGVVVLLFTCKCAILLTNERRKLENSQQNLAAE